MIKEKCPTCGGECEMSWAGLELVENTGDETLATKCYTPLAPSLKEENEQLKQLENNFYMAICRAYNAGKQNQINQQLAKGSPDEGKMFLSSHDYFLTQFPNFKTNVP